MSLILNQTLTKAIFKLQYSGLWSFQNIASCINTESINWRRVLYNKLKFKKTNNLNKVVAWIREYTHSDNLFLKSKIIFVCNQVYLLSSPFQSYGCIFSMTSSCQTPARSITWPKTSSPISSSSSVSRWPSSLDITTWSRCQFHRHLMCSFFV